MEILHMDAIPQGTDACVVALGFFDGLHIGHAALLEKTVAEAAARGLSPCVFTFADDPTFKDGQRLCVEEERLSRFADFGIARVVTADFPALSGLSPEAFVEEVLLGTLNAAAVVCGFNYRFGRGAAGDVALLSSLLATHGVPLFAVAERAVGGVTVSTSAIKAALAAGDAEMARAMLGRPYSLTGTVTHGKALGRKIGVPTANVPFPDRIFTPKRGVFAVSCEIEGMAGELTGLANVGVRPTVKDGGKENCEVHFLDSVGDLYGRRVCVRFLHFIRPEMTFPDLAALVSRIDLDKQIAKEYFNKWNGQN